MTDLLTNCALIEYLVLGAHGEDPEETVRKAWPFAWPFTPPGDAIKELKPSGGRTGLARKGESALILHLWHGMWLLQLVVNLDGAVCRAPSLTRVDYLPESTVLLQGELSATTHPHPQPEAVATWATAYLGLGSSVPIGWWGELPVGILVMLTAHRFVLASPGHPERLERFVYEQLARYVIADAKVRQLYSEAESLYGLLRCGKSSDHAATDHVGKEAAKDTKEDIDRHHGLIPVIEDRANRALALTVTKPLVRKPGSRDADDLLHCLQQIRLDLARLGKASADAAQIEEAMIVDVANMMEDLDDLRSSDGDFVSRTRRRMQRLLDTMAFWSARLDKTVARTEAVASALNELTVESRDLMEQDQVRLEGLQTSLIAAVGVLIGVLQVTEPAPAVSAAALTFWISYFALTLRRAKTFLDYSALTIAAALAAASVAFWSWAPDWSPPWDILLVVAAFAGGGVLGGVVSIRASDRWVDRWFRE